MTKSEKLAMAIANGLEVSQQIADMNRLLIEREADKMRAEYPTGTTATEAALNWDEERNR